MDRSPSLAELQRWTRWTLTHPLGIDRALACGPAPGLADRFTEPPASAIASLAGDDVSGRSARDRLAIHSGGYFSRLHGTLAMEYPRLSAALGPETFRALVAAHLLRNPSSSPSLADLGADLSSTLADSGLGAPWCVDLARLERAFGEVWLSDTAPAAALPPPPGGDWERLRLGLSPALRLLRLDFDVADWEPGAPPAAPLVHSLVVWRAGGSTGLERLEPGPEILLHALADGRALGDACGIADASGVDAETVSRAFSEWASRGWVSGATELEPLR
jgi:putative DNA-binding protein